jgi:hypothetical protein
LDGLLPPDWVDAVGAELDVVFLLSPGLRAMKATTATTTTAASSAIRARVVI